MRHILAFMLFLIVVTVSCVGVFAANETKNTAEEYKIELGEFDVECKSALLMEAKTGTVLYSKNEEESYSPASVTKVMTLLLVMEAIERGNIAIDDEVTVSAYAARMGGSQVFLEEGERMSVRELIKCAVIASGNDAAVALAEHTSGSEGAFVAKMNERARELGLKSSSFENVTGLDDTTTDHKSSALDIAMMSRELIKYPIITEYSSMWQDSIRDGEFVLTNTNRLVRYYDGCNGLKTGSTDKAGYCVSATARRGNMQLIAVIMGAPSRDMRNKIARELLDYGFASYGLYETEGREVGNIPVYSGKQETSLAYTSDFCRVVNKSDLSSVKVEHVLPDKLVAPISDGECVGTVKYFVGNKLLGEEEIVVKNGVEELELFDIFVNMLKNNLAPSSKKEE